MTTITTQFSVGDVVYHAGTTTERKQHPCPDCKGLRQWTAVSPAGAEYQFACPRCAASYRSFDGTGLDYTTFTPTVSKLTIGSVRFNSADGGAEYMCHETGVGSGRIYKEADMFADHDAALRVATLRAAVSNRDTEWVVTLYDKTLQISDYQLSGALIEVAKTRERGARSMLFNLGFLFDDINEAADKDAILELVADYQRRDWENDKREASAIEARRAETAQTGSVGDESAGPKDDAQPSGSPTPILPKKERPL